MCFYWSRGEVDMGGNRKDLRLWITLEIVLDHVSKLPYTMMWSILLRTICPMYVPMTMWSPLPSNKNHYSPFNFFTKENLFGRVSSRRISGMQLCETVTISKMHIQQIQIYRPLQGKFIGGCGYNMVKQNMKFAYRVWEDEWSWFLYFQLETPPISWSLWCLLWFFLG